MQLYTLDEPFNKAKSQAVIELFTQTFADSEGEAEGKVIGRLVEEMITTTDKTDLFIFIAEENDKLIGSVCFSRLTFDSEHQAFILSPMAIATPEQGKGFGQTLINYALEQLTAVEVDFVFTYGDPSFYTKVGFQSITEDVVKAPFPLSFPHSWLAQSLNTVSISELQGQCRCVPALCDAKYW